MEKDISPNETVENLEILISLNYGEMDTCKLVYNNQTLKNKDAKLREVFPYVETKEGEPETVYEVKVAKKGDLDAFGDITQRISNLYQSNPLIVGGVIVAIIFFILFLIGSSS